MIGAAPDVWRIVLAVMVVAGLLGLVPILLRRFRPPAVPVAGMPERPQIVAQQSLDMRHRIVVVRYRQTEHLLLLGGSLPVLVGQQPTPLTPATVLPGEPS
jgi:flagellar biogenesis protein FliO